MVGSHHSPSDPRAPVARRKPRVRTRTASLDFLLIGCNVSRRGLSSGATRAAGGGGEGGIPRFAARLYFYPDSRLRSRPFVER